jgi:hypothetical protein
MRHWTDAELWSALQALEGRVEPDPRFAELLFDELVRATLEARADAGDVGSQATPVGVELGPKGAMGITADAARVVVPFTPLTSPPSRRGGRWRLGLLVVAAAVVVAVALGLSRWREGDGEAVVAGIPERLVQLEQHCRAALPPLESAIESFDEQTDAGRGVLTADDVRTVLSGVDDFATGAVASLPGDELDEQIRRPLQQAIAAAGEGLQALAAGGVDSARGAIDEMFLAQRLVAAALRVANGDGAVSCRPGWS